MAEKKEGASLPEVLNPDRVRIVTQRTRNDSKGGVRRWPGRLLLEVVVGTTVRGCRLRRITEAGVDEAVVAAVAAVVDEEAGPREGAVVEQPEEEEEEAQTRAAMESTCVTPGMGTSSLDCVTGRRFVKKRCRRIAMTEFFGWPLESWRVTKMR